MLSGAKTYIVAALAGLGAFAINVGWLDTEGWAHVEPILLAAGLFFARLATGKVEKKL